MTKEKTGTNRWLFPALTGSVALASAAVALAASPARDAAAKAKSKGARRTTAEAAPELRLDGARITVERDANDIDRVVVYRGPRRQDSAELERRAAGPRLLGLAVVDASARVFVVDYDQGSSGTSVMVDCAAVSLFRLGSEGRLERLDAQRYRCEASGVEADPVQDSFYYRYSVEKTAAAPGWRVKLEADPDAPAP